MARQRRWRRIPEDKRREVMRLAVTGLSAERIAREVRLGESSVRRVLVPLGGVIRAELWRPPAGCLTLDQRVEVKIALERGWSYADIGAKLGFHRSSIWREVEGNGGRRRYAPMMAHRKACVRRQRPKPTKLSGHAELKAFVIDGLERLWSPEQIARRLVEEFPDDPEMRVSHETIYKSLYVQGRGELRRELTACLRTARTARKAKGRVEHRGHIPGMVNISERPAEVADRAVPGHWEGDLILGANGSSAVGTLVERSTRFVMLLHLAEARTAEAVREAMTAKILTLPQALRRTITWDQGREMTQHAQFSVDTGVEIYFCDPHSPWQRGSNENTNGLLRQYMPKGTNLRRYSPEDLDAIADSLNGRPRNTLGWKTPSERLNEVLVALTG